MLIMRGVKYGSTFCAVGARGFAGEGYPYQKVWRLFGMNWAGTAFAGKTMTLNYHEGNMPLKEDGVTPKEWFPKCIWGSLRNGGEMVNQVGLSNFGLHFYLRSGIFHKLREPFMTSVMLKEQTPEARKQEMMQIAYLLRDHMSGWMKFVPWALQINFACPNTDHDLTVFYAEIVELILIAKSILVGVPIVANVNALMPTEVLVAAAEVADALWIGNAIPFGGTPDIDWNRFGGKSPLARRNSEWKGGLSSPACLPLTMKALMALRKVNRHIPIVAGNGIRTVGDVSRLAQMGANAVFIGSVAVVRPRRMPSIIKYSNQRFA